LNRAAGGSDPGPAGSRRLWQRLWPLLRALAGLGILVTLGVRLGAGPFVDGLRAVGYLSVLAALVIGLLTTVFSAWRWCLVARGLGLRLSLPDAVAGCYRALFLNSVLPAGVLGDVHRAVSHGRRSGDLARGVRAVVIERVAGQVVLVIVTGVVVAAHPTLLAAVPDLAPAFAIVLAVLAVAAVVAKRAVSATWCQSTTLRSRTRPWAGITLLSAAALTGYLALFVIAARAAGSTATLGDLLPVLLLALLAMGLPVNVGGWGPREAVTAAGFGVVGLGAAQGLSVAVGYGVLSFVACLPGLGVLLLHRRGFLAGTAAPTASTGRQAPRCT
jgi:uncharacterized membrane protein YbhN (UPF0104 family)